MSNTSKQDLMEKWGGATCSRAWDGWDPDVITKTEGQDLIDAWIAEWGWPPVNFEPAVPDGLVV